MKNLRKVLAVVLVVCMAFSLMAVASAKNLVDYTDASTVTSKEAVDVMIGAGVMTGDGGTTWNPTGTFTREQAAKVVASILSNNAGSFTVTTSSFTDVAATRWSAPYIQYAVSKDVISGRGDGTFGPTDPVTGAQMAVMLLKALGYGKNNEFATNWEINAIDLGLEKGVLSGTANFSAPATREQVAQYVLNAIQKQTATFSKDTGEYTLGANPLLGAKTGIAKTATSVVNGMTVYNYTKNAVAITGNYSIDKLIGSSSNGTDYADLVLSTNAKFIAADTGAVVYYNGEEMVGAGNIAAATATVSDKGVVVSFYNNDTDAAADSVVIIDKEIATLGAIALTSTTVDLGITGGAQVFAKVPGYASFATGDVVAYYMSFTDSVWHVEKCASFTAKLTALTATTYTIGGAVYMVSELAALDGTLDNTVLNLDKVYYTDPTGYIVKVANTPAAPAATVFYGYATDYAQAYVVPATLISPAVPAYEIIKFVDSTGATVIKNTVLDPAATAGALTTAAIDDDLFAYTLSPDGKIATISAATDVTVAGQVTQGSPYTYTAGSAYFASATTTIFYSDVDNDVAVYTGYANALTTTTATQVGSFAFTNKALLVKLTGQLPGTPASAANFALIVDNTITTSFDVTTNKYVWTVNALNTAGAAIQLKWTSTDILDIPTVAKGLVEYTLTAGFIALPGDLANIATVDQEVTQVESNFFVQNGAAVSYTSATKFFVLTKTGADFTGIASSLTIPANSATNDTTVVYSAGAPVTVVFYVVGAVD